MRFADHKNGETPRWWPSSWNVPTWGWMLITFGILLLLSIIAVDSFYAFTNLFATWIIIWVIVFISKWVENKYKYFVNRQHLNEQRTNEEYHGLSVEEQKIWEDLKNKLNKKS